MAGLFPYLGGLTNQQAAGHDMISCGHAIILEAEFDT